ncbi:hypothetical protein PhCBS80983_g05615 [Powellomyces hirtus]|uniref:SnoaL-like domain-containing protein n=1 Tax=Powellomyces hirtus TaxID=109895 RepID=A0A507DV53_9FUNG|nr:hypothetical protein PhCBS80983_g05615 [Powellomyces hirtus]
MLSSTPTPSPSLLVSHWDAHKSSLLNRQASATTAAALVPTLFADDASVVYVPTAAGAEGVKGIELFFRKFAEQNEVVTEEKLINRVVSATSIAEETILTVVHDSTIDWLLPDVKPTNRRVLIPMSTFVLFDNEGKIKAKRVYWDQGTVMKQIGLLPASLFCKANGSETVPPVLGPRVVDRLVDARAEPNLILKEHWEDAPVAGVASKGETAAARAHSHEAAHGILPSGDADHDIHVAEARRLARASNAATKHSSDESTARPPRASSQQRHQPGQTSELSSILENKPSDVPVRSSTRIHHAQAAQSNDIFGTEHNAIQPVKTGIPIDQRRFQSSIDFGFAAVAAEDQHNAAASTVLAAGQRPSSGRRDPNWSSEAASQERNNGHHTVSSKKLFGTAHTVETANDDAQIDYAHVGKKHFSGDQKSHFSISNEHNESYVNSNTGNNINHHGRKHSAMAHQDNDIFGAAKANDERPRSSGKRDPNARSTEAVMARPSSRVLRPPGGGQSFSFA